MNDTKPATLRDVYDRLDQLGYSPTTYRDVRRDVARAPQLHGVASLRDIPADLDAFDALWRDRDDALVLGFSSPRAFRLWRTHVRGAIRRARGEAASASTTRDDAWQPILDYLQAEGWNRDKKLIVLAQRARREGLAPRNVDGSWLAERHAALRSPHRSSLRQGAAALNELVERAKSHSEIREYLPVDVIPLPETSAPKRFGGIILPQTFHNDLQLFLAWRQAQRADPLDDPDRGGVTSRDTDYVNTLSWLVQELVRIGAITPEEITEIADVVAVTPIRDAAKALRTRRESGELKAEASTLHTYLRNLRYIARHWIVLPDEDVEAISRMMRSQSAQTRSVEGMAVEREQWLKKVILSENSSIRDAVLAMPDTLIKHADAGFAQWDTLSQTQRARTLRAAQAAAMTAIMLRAMALRFSNVRYLRVRGDEPTLITPGKTRSARIEIPGREVKNGRDLSAPVPGIAWRILKRWLNIYRPILIENHPTGHDAMDSPYLFPGSKCDAPASENSLRRAFDYGIELLGLGMTPHMCRHAIAGLILHKDPSKLPIVADFLGDTPETVRKKYHFLDTNRASADAQYILERETTAAKRRRRKAA